MVKPAARSTSPAAAIVRIGPYFLVPLAALFYFLLRRKKAAADVTSDA